MYKRKIVLTGKSSFVVTLPKDWIEKHKLEKKQDVFFLPLDDGTLLLTPTLAKKEYKKLLKITKETKISHLKRLFYSAYLGGYSEILIKSDSVISSEIRAEIKIMTSNLIGIESGEESPDSLTFRSMVHSESMRFHDLVSTLMEMTRSMHENAFEALSKGEIDIAKFVLDRDKEVNPKNHAITRMMNTYLQDLTLTQSLDISLIEAQSNFAISLFLESLADYAVLISRNVIDLIKTYPIDASIIKVLEIGGNFVNTMKKIFSNWENRNSKGIRASLGQKNVDNANSLLDNLAQLNRKCEKMIQNTQKNTNFSIISAILEKIRRSIKVLSNIALISIDLVDGILTDE